MAPRWQFFSTRSAFFWSSSMISCFLSGMRRSVIANDRPASVDCLKPSLLHVVEQVDRRRPAEDPVAVGDDAAAALGRQGAVVERHAFGGRMSLKISRPTVVVTIRLAGIGVRCSPSLIDDVFVARTRTLIIVCMPICWRL